VSRGRREFWAEGFQPHDSRGIAGHAWYEAAEDLDVATLPEADARRLLAEAINHVRQLLDSSDDADRYEDLHEGLDAALAARRIAAAALLADYMAEAASATLRHPPVREWMLRLATELGGLLDALGEHDLAVSAQIAGVVITSEQLEVLTSALADAIAHRYPGQACADCETSPSELCEDCAADLDLAEAYRALARELGIEVDR
jgi:hypothetical protein